ncbi:MAG TPA: hypothetical protein VHN77_15430 [Phycisphaerales bacterium]|nr:hypothetical protein [Phycisphaerales bacterium]
MTPSRLSIAAGSATILLSAPHAAAQCIGMPVGASGYLEASNSNIPCGEVVSGTESLPVPSGNYCSANSCAAGQVLRANADHNAQRLRMATYRSMGTPLHVHNGMADRYTITGPPGTEGTPVTVRIVCRMSGTLFTPFHGIIGGQPMYYYPVNSISMEVGTWAPGTNSDFHEQFRVTPFSQDFVATATWNAPQSNVMLFNPIDMTIDQPLTRTVGTQFEIGYYMVNATGSAGNSTGSTNPSDDQYIVTTIDWDLPPGYTITSERGWTDPDAPACDPIDFNGDGLFPDTADIDDYLSVFSGGPCSTGACGDIDFNNDGLFPDTADIDSLLSVFSGGPCL